MSAAGRVALRVARPFVTAAVLASCLAIAACRTVSAPPAPVAPVAPPAAPAPAPEVLQHYRIDADQSQVLILVYRDGPLAQLGHNHVLSVHELSGEVYMLSDPMSARFWLQFPVAAMTVDDPALRAAQGEDFAAGVDAAAIQGTRAHMLSERLLDAARFPVIRLQSQSLQVEGDRWLVRLQITVRDHDSVATEPISVTLRDEDLTASGEFDLTHAQLGLTPYSVGAGALRVAQVMHVRLRLVARRQLL
jgi:sulfur transfer complex TusBCD TusB component (DsrH family)